MSGRFASNWIGTDFDVGKAFAVEKADYVEYKYAQLVTYGIIDKHSGFPKLEGLTLWPSDEDNLVWTLTAAAVKRYRFVSDDATGHDPQDDIDPLVWQFQERNGQLHSVQIKRLSKVTAAHRAALTDQEKERIVARSYHGRSTIVRPLLEGQSRIEDRGTKAPNKGAEIPQEQKEDVEPSRTTSTTYSRGFKRKAEGESAQEHGLRRKLVRTGLGARTIFTRHVGDSFIRESSSRRMARHSTQIGGASRHRPNIVASLTPSETIDNEGETGLDPDSAEEDYKEEAQVVLMMKEMRSSAPRTWRAMMDMKSAEISESDEEDSREDAMAAVTMNEMRSSAPRTWQAMMEMKDAELLDSDDEDIREDIVATEMMEEMCRNAPRTWRAMMEAKDATLDDSTEENDWTSHTSSVEARELPDNEGKKASEARQGSQRAWGTTTTNTTPDIGTVSTRRSTRQTSRPQSYVDRY